ncbi:MAG: 2-C-methyl-D-erythritol 4-phosphate cytidylyltransferase [Pseudanabaena frigida]|uniref:2-C-methyl-D-erythritol 4-phosphate cytidylyltransferase n=1 Tax=Pseudanabaena frigida TaxID=945775 RepID=A0A2W4WBG4_9CYAN|nr:MAG: 2-C-methyl-D-erythritol 4-phosphate cytidylyltransferase [Pseudanabaena frigida]
MTCHLLIPAAGSGKRMGADRNKLLLPLIEKPILLWTLEAAIASEAIAWIGVIGQPHDYPEFQKIFHRLNTTKPIHLIQGGTTRQASVFNGLKSLPSNGDRVLIHDGARCLATPQLFDRCDKALQTMQGFIAAVPVKDTIKIVDGQTIVDTPNRDHLWAAQTPQGFQADLLKNAHLKAVELGWEVTDDAALFEKVGLPVQIVMGEETNLKITTPQDLAIAEFILKQRN